MNSVPTRSESPPIYSVLRAHIISGPCHVASDAFGDIYVCTQNESYRLYKIHYMNSRISLLTDLLTHSQLKLPLSVTISPTSGTVYFGDSTCVRRVETMGSKRFLSIVAGGTTTGDADGLSRLSRFNHISGIALDQSETNIYLCDSMNNSIKRVCLFDLSVKTIAKTSSVRPIAPWGIAIDEEMQRVYFSDQQNHRILFIDIRAGGQGFATLAGSGHPGHRDGPPKVAQFFNPHQLTFVPEGNYLLVADRSNYAIRKIDREGNVTTLNIQGTRLKCPCGLTYRSNGITKHPNLIVADTRNNRVIELFQDFNQIINHWPSTHSQLSPSMRTQIEYIILCQRVHIPKDIMLAIVKYLVVLNVKFVTLNMKFN